MNIDSPKKGKGRLIIGNLAALSLVVCLVLAGIYGVGTAGENPSKEESHSQNLIEEEGGESQEDPTEEKGQKEEGEKPESPEAGGQQNAEKEQVTAAAAAPKAENSQTSKPMVVPTPLSGDQLYSAFNETLIIGDSRIEGFRLYSGVKNATYFCTKALSIDKIVDGNRLRVGDGDYTVYEVLEQGSFKKVIIGVGLNELGWTHIESFLGKYGALIDAVHERQPGATIYIHAVLPVSREKSDKDKTVNNAQIYWYNQNLINLAAGKGARFTNPAAALVDQEGYLLPGSTTDGVHLNSQSCKTWATYLAELM